MTQKAVDTPTLAVGDSAEWQIRTQRLPLREPLIMGILNVTPDSFSDGGLFQSGDQALRRAEEMVREGAHLLDVGGESTRPGAREVSAEEEIDRVIPIVQALRDRVGVPISIDTRKAAVAREAIAAGAEVVNDVSALGDPEMAAVVSSHAVGVVLMHMRGNPESMQRDPHYDDVVREVGDELKGAAQRAREAGIDRGRIVLDPGIGFAKTAAHNLELIARLAELCGLGYPIMLGVSRKAFIGRLLGNADPSERTIGTAAACVAGLLHGARIFRVHDVRVVREALTIGEAIRVARS